MSFFNPTSAPVIMPGGLVAWENLFTAAELDAVERYGDSLTQERAELQAKASGRDSIRITRVAWSSFMRIEATTAPTAVPRATTPTRLEACVVL